MKKLSLFSLFLVVALVLGAIQPFGFSRGLFDSVGAVVLGEAGAINRTLPVGAAPGLGSAQGQEALASQVMRFPVLNPAGDPLGQVINLLSDETAGCVRYAVMAYSPGGNLAGERAIPVPLNLLTLAGPQQAVTLDIDRATLANAPGFDRYAWPDFGRPGWDNQIRAFWQGVPVPHSATAEASGTCGSAQTGAAGPAAAAGGGTPTPALGSPSAASAASLTSMPATGGGMGSRTATPNAAPAGTGTANSPVASGAPAASAAASPGPGGGAAAVNPLGLVVVTLREYTIAMPNTVSAGLLTFVVTNLGRVSHNFAIVGEGVEHRFERDLRPGESQSMSLTLLPGTYQVYCPVDNHRDQGMRMTLTVTGATAEQAAAGESTAAPAPNSSARAATPVPAATAPGGAGSSGRVSGTPAPGATLAANATPGTATGASAGSLERVSRLADYRLLSADGQRLGAVADVVFAWDTGQMLYVAAIRAAGAAAGTGGAGAASGATGTATVAGPAAPNSATPGANSGQVGSNRPSVLIPWQALVVDNADRTLVLRAPAAVFGQAPTVMLGPGLDTSRPGWDAASQNFWRGVGIAPGAPAAGGTVTATATATSAAVSVPATPAAGATASPTPSSIAGQNAPVTPAATAGTAVITSTATSATPLATAGTAVVTTTATAPVGPAATPLSAAGPTTPANVSTPATSITGTPIAGPTALPTPAAGPVMTATVSGTALPFATPGVGAAAGGTAVAGPTAATGTAGPVLAPATPAVAAGGGPSQAAGLMPVNAIIGFGATDSAGKDLGHISELIGSLDAGRVTYAILTSGGVLGIGGQSEAVPWTAFRLNQQQDAFVVNADQATVQQTPGFDQAAIDRGDPNWDATVRTYWENHGLPVGAPGSATAAGRPVRVTRLLRSSAKASSGANLGTITSILVAMAPGGSGPTPAQVTPTPRGGPAGGATPAAGTAGTGGAAGGSATAESGRFMYAIIGFGGILGFGEQAVPVPWDAFTVDPQSRTFTGKFDEQTFQQAPSIDIGKLPQTPTAGWDSAIQEYWAGRMGGR